MCIALSRFPRGDCPHGRPQSIDLPNTSVYAGILVQISYRLENRRRDQKYGKVANSEATVETRDLADKVRRSASHVCSCHVYLITSAIGRLLCSAIYRSDLSIALICCLYIKAAFPFISLLLALLQPIPLGLSSRRVKRTHPQRSWKQTPIDRVSTRILCPLWTRLLRMFSTF